MGAHSEKVAIMSKVVDIALKMLNDSGLHLTLLPLGAGTARLDMDVG
jgi:hypothetical protein